MRKKMTAVQILLTGAALFAICFGNAVEEAHASSKPRSKRYQWQIKLDAQGELEHNSNVFRLSPAQEGKIKLDLPGDQVSGRFKDMESVSDLIFSPSLAFKALIRRSLFGRKLSLRAGVRYHQYRQNPKMSYANVGLSIQQEISKRSKLRFRSEYIPSRFRKNYLAEAIDDTGQVTRDERIYREGVYREWDVALDYKHRFLKRKKGKLGLTGDILVGYTLRRYDAPFEGRDKEALRGRLLVDLDLTKWWKADVEFTYESVDRPVGQEVLILDEPDFLVDFSGDGDQLDIDIRTVQRIDRSYVIQRIEVSTQFDLTKSLDFSAGYERFMRDYSSREPIDPIHIDREDRRDAIKLELDYRVWRGLNFKASYKQVIQKTNRSGDPGSLGEITDYKAMVFSGGLVYRF